MELHSIIILFVTIIGIKENLALSIRSDPELDTIQIKPVRLEEPIQIRQVRLEGSIHQFKPGRLESVDENVKLCQCERTELRRADYDYVSGLGSYKLHTVAKSWNEARRICEKEDARLAIINSKAEEAALMKIFREKTDTITGAARKDEAYLGIHDMFKESEWVTVSGESLYKTGYSEWSTYWYGAVQPDNVNGRQNCGALILYGQMDDVYCDTKLAFFCELPQVRSLSKD